MLSRRWVLVVGGAALAVALAAGAVVWVTTRRADDHPDPDAAAARFVDAWERSRLGTYVVAGISTRITPDGGELVSPVELVQRPPDYIRRQFGGADARLGDRPVNCSTTPEGTVECHRGESERTYEELVADEVERWAGYFSGDPEGLYRVDEYLEGCFELTLTRAYPSPPYGDLARFCFDPGTGAIIFSEVRRDEATDTTEMTEIRPEVSDADLVLEQG